MATTETIIAIAILIIVLAILILCALSLGVNVNNQSHGNSNGNGSNKGRKCPMNGKSNGGCPKGACPVLPFYGEGTTGRRTNRDWWPNQPDITILDKNSNRVVPDPKFDYAKAFSELNMDELKCDILEMMKTSQNWWPADFGFYGPLFIRLSWHSAGTYRSADGRGGSAQGTIRFAPQSAWPDNINLDKAKRLLWPIKKKYGMKISWSDLLILVGTCAFEYMGVKSYGFGGGRTDVWESQEVYWGDETAFLTDERVNKDGTIDEPFATTEMGLIYQNPQGPNGVPDPKATAKQTREIFRRMAMNDRETVALIAGGHSFGKCHGVAPTSNLGKDPECAPLYEQGLGWENKFGTGKGPDTITSGFEGSWIQTPIKFSKNYFRNLLNFTWKTTKSPAGAIQWIPVDGKKDVPDAFDCDKCHLPIMLTVDIGLKEDPEYHKICEEFYKDHKKFEVELSKAWYKLTHRDLGPRVRLLGDDIPPPQIWQDPIPPSNEHLSRKDISKLKGMIKDSCLSVGDLVRVAWRSAATFRHTDFRGGANGARIYLEPQIGWKVNEPRWLKRILNELEGIRENSGTSVSMADLIVLAGGTGIEMGAKKGGYNIDVPFVPGNSDTTQKLTDVESFEWLNTGADGFINYYNKKTARMRPELEIVDMSERLRLTAPEMTVLVGGMRSLGANYKDNNLGVFSRDPGVLSTDWFTTLTDIDLFWEKSEDNNNLYYGYYSDSPGESLCTKLATRVDMVFGWSSRLKPLVEYYAQNDNQEIFAKDFVSAWVKVMQLDRYDLHN